MGAYLFQIALEKSTDYLLITYKWQFLSCFSILCGKWRQQAASTLLDENLTCEFKCQNSFTLSKSCMKTEQFLFTVKSSVYSQLSWRTWPQSKEKLLAVLIRLSCQLYFEWLRNCVQETIELWPKYSLETKLKPTKKQNFLAVKDIFLTSPGCCLT